MSRHRALSTTLTMAKWYCLTDPEDVIRVLRETGGRRP